MSLPDDLPRRAAPEGARLVSLALLSDVELESARLGDPADAEGLHDFRVALRRLRSTLRSWKRELDESVRGKDRRALKALQEATGGGRDAEVALAWLEARRGELTADQVGDLERVVAPLAERLAGLHADDADALREGLGRVAARLRARLPRRVVLHHVDRPLEEPSWAVTLGEAARREARALAAALDGAGSPEERERLHAARIEGKRLRYLLEPARPWSEAAAALVKRLKGLQDVLGEIQDAHVLADELAGHEGGGEGLELLRRRNRERLEELFARLRAEWLGAGVEALRAEVEAFASAFAPLGRGDVERERKYLLDRLPQLPADAETLDVEQGWLPGERLRERLRRVRGPSGERLERALKLGRGLERTEIEEPLSRELFEALWPLTGGCRVLKRRHRVRVGAHLWEVDEFLDRDLVLAEVELERVDERPEPPPWLAPRIVREVTEEGAFTNLALAEAGPGAVPRR
jgi:CHAD domain-containing protein/CYTH domain-containing protein